MLPDHPNINRLREVISNETPEIFGGNWGSMLDAGWRHETTYSLEDVGKVIGWIHRKQFYYGITRVAIGQPWDGEKMMPQPYDNYIGLYVCDVDEQLSHFHDRLKEFEGFDVSS